MLGGSGPWASQTQLGRDRHRVRAAGHPVPCPCSPPLPAQGATTHSRVGRAAVGSWWHQALTMPVPSFALRGWQDCHRPHRHLPTAGPGGRTGRAPPGQQCVRRGRAGGGSEGMWLREPSRGHGSTARPWQRPQPRPHTAEPSPGHTGPAPAPAPPESRVPARGAGRAHRTHPWQGQSQRGSRTHLSRRAGTSRRAAQPWPCWSWQRPWHHPQLEAERRQLSTTPTAPREPKHSPVLPRVPSMAGTWGQGWASPGHTGSFP